jgi:cytochrome c-type biogenesis protein CcmH
VVVALVLLNLSLGGLLLYRKTTGLNGGRGGMPPGHPDVSVPGMNGPTGGDALPPGHPAVSGGADMAPEFAAVEAAAARGSAPAAALSLRGTVRLSPSLKDPWPQGSPVFVIARGEGGGPPFAARRYDGVKAPFRYSLGPADAMIAGSALPAKLVVSVRVDQDGDALTRQLGDLEGGPSSPVGPRGSADVTVDRPSRLVR